MQNQLLCGTASGTAVLPWQYPAQVRNNYYAVRKGHTRGIFESWEECRPEVEGIANEFKGFKHLSDAQAYLNTDHSSSVPE